MEKRDLEAEEMADKYLREHGNELFLEFRKDGWPLCPQCGEDELWSDVAMSVMRSVTLEECWGGDFTCYYCNWKSNGRRHIPEAASELLITCSEAVL